MNDLDNKIKNIFQIKTFSTLSDAPCRERIDLSNDDKSMNPDIIISKVIKILNNHFKKNIWIRIILWDKTEEIELDNLVLKPIRNFLKFKRIEDGSLILYYFIEDYDPKTTISLVKSSIYFDLGIDPSIDMTCLYFNFEKPVLINIYDDRGMDVVKPII